MLTTGDRKQTLHGPSSGNFDEAADIPTLMTDWSA